MTIMEARPSAQHLSISDEIADYLGKTLSSGGVTLYTEDANQLAERVALAKVDEGSIGVIDLENPALAEVKDDVPAAVDAALQDPNYLVVNLSLESIADEVVDMIEDDFLEDTEKVQEEFRSGLQFVETATVLRAILRAIQGSRIFRREYMTNEQTIRSVNNDSWEADPAAIRNVTCHECWTIKSATGACACSE